MIYTITFNPALDYVMEVNGLELGLVNRSKSEHILCGGKGINVSIVLKNLELESIVLGFIAGFTGDEITSRVNAMGIKTDFIKLASGESRINVKIKDSIETEINGKGPNITDSDIELLYDKIDRLQDGDVLVLAGSIPSTVSDDVYENIMKRVSNKEIKVIVDATQNLLINVLKYKPFLVKPNHHELEEICGVRCESVADVMHYGRKIKDMGAENVLVSMADKGAVLITDSNTYYMKAPSGVIKNSVGAGDSMVAGFLAKFLVTGDYKEALRYSIATGSASAFSENLATKSLVEGILDKVEVIA